MLLKRRKEVYKIFSVSKFKIVLFYAIIEKRFELLKISFKRLLYYSKKGVLAYMEAV